jgi:fibronectin type 3 domain-containing protein
VALTWTSVLPATGYVVSRSTTNGGNYTAVTGNLTTNSYNDTGLTNGVTYYYVVSATNGEDVSGNSTQASATPLGTPTGLTATPGTGNVTLTWTAGAGATGYTVERSTTSGSGYTTVATNVSTTTYKDTTAANGTTYYYVVVATNASGSSGDSVQASATPQPPAPAAPTGLTATAGNGNVTLNWTADSGATSYLVQRSTSSGSGYAIVNGAVATNAYSDTGLINGTTYYYVVAAANGGGTSPNSSEVTATPAATLTQWASAAFGNSTDPAVIGPNANPAGDGIPNLLKYFYGLDPATNSGTPPVSTTPDNSGNLVLTFRLAKNLTGVTYQIQSSPDLLNWTNTGVLGTEVSDQGTYYIMQAAVPMNGGTKLYLRVSVTQSP